MVANQIDSTMPLPPAVLDSLTEEVVVVDAQGIIMFVNAAWKRGDMATSPMATPLVAGANYLAVLRKAAAADMKAKRCLTGLEGVLSGQSKSSECEYSRTDAGQKRWFSQRVSPLLVPSGGVVVARTDITARKQAEEERETHRFELGRAVRAATLGQLSGALAHELNQPLSAILTNAQVALLTLHGTAARNDLPDMLADIERDARRAGRIINRLRRMLQNSGRHLEQVDPRRLIEETLKLCRSELLSRRIRIETALDDDVGCLYADATAVQHLLLNLFINAYEAMSDCGPENRLLSIACQRSDPAGLVITVCDNGPGLEQSARERLFEPLYTTKPSGLGLGLSICRSIADAHGASIDLADREPRGTVATIVFPFDTDSGLGGEA